MFEDRDRRESFLEYLRNLSPQVFLLTAGVFFYHLGQKENSCVKYLFLSVGAGAGIFAIFGAWASAIQFYRRYVGEAPASLAVPSKASAGPIALVFIAVFALVVVAFVIAALSAERLLG